MSDDKKNRGPADRARINMSEAYEVRYWTEKFGCSAEALGAAVKSAGSSADAVEKYLKTSK